MLHRVHTLSACLMPSDLTCNLYMCWGYSPAFSEALVNYLPHDLRPQGEPAWSTDATPTHLLNQLPSGDQEILQEPL